MYDMHNITKTKLVIYSAGLSLVLLFFSHGMAQTAKSGGDPNQKFSAPPVLPGVIEPPRFQGFTTESPGDFHYPPEMIKDMERKKRQIEEKGYIEISESQALVLERRMSNIQERKERNEHIHTLQDVQSTLGFQPADLQLSPLGKAEIIETTTSGGRVQGKWAGVNRLFKVKKFGLVELDEWDFTVDHGGVYVNPDAINQNINGFPATLSVGKSPSGHWLTTLAWYTDTKVFQLTANHPIKPQKMIDEFIQLAEGIQ